MRPHDRPRALLVGEKKRATDNARRSVDARRSNNDLAAKPGVDHARVFQIEEDEYRSKDEDEDGEYGEPNGREDASNQALSRLFSLEYPGLRLLCDSYQGSTNSRSFHYFGRLDSCFS